MEKEDLDGVCRRHHHKYSCHSQGAPVVRVLDFNSATERPHPRPILGPLTVSAHIPPLRAYSRFNCARPTPTLMLTVSAIPLSCAGEAALVKKTLPPIPPKAPNTLGPCDPWLGAAGTWEPAYATARPLASRPGDTQSGPPKNRPPPAEPLTDKPAHFHNPKSKSPAPTTPTPKPVSLHALAFCLAGGGWPLTRPPPPPSLGG